MKKAALIVLVTHFCADVLKTAATGLVIFIQREDGVSIPLELSPDAQVADLYSGSGLSADGYRLLFGDRELDDLNVPLADLGVGTQSVLAAKQFAVPIEFRFTPCWGEPLPGTPRREERISYSKSFDHSSGNYTYHKHVRGDAVVHRCWLKFDAVDHDFFQDAMQCLEDAALFPPHQALNVYFRFVPPSMSFEGAESFMEYEGFRLEAGSITQLTAHKMDAEQIGEAPQEETLEDDRHSSHSYFASGGGGHISIPNRIIKQDTTLQQLMHWYPDKPLEFPGRSANGATFSILFTLPDSFSLSIKKPPQRRLLSV